MYRVIKFFTDLQDNSFPYKVGDAFPRDGVSVSQARLDELSSNKNRRKMPLITLCEEKAAEKSYTKTEIYRMSTASLKALAEEKGLENVNSCTGAELKAKLISQLGL